jgi:hypothetical protein
MAKKLYSAYELADLLFISRQALDRAITEGRIEKNDYVTGEGRGVRGWTPEQVKKIQKYYKRRDG